MFRTVLVLLFLAACGVYFHQNDAPAPASHSTSSKPRGSVLDESNLQALKQALPAQLFERDIKPALEQDKREGLNSEQLKQLLERLNAMSKELGGKAAEAASKAARSLEQAMPKEKGMAEKGTEAAGELARKASDELKKNLPALKELSSDLLNGMVAVLSQLLSSAAELLKK